MSVNSAKTIFSDPAPNFRPFRTRRIAVTNRRSRIGARGSIHVTVRLSTLEKGIRHKLAPEAVEGRHAAEREDIRSNRCDRGVYGGRRQSNPGMLPSVPANRFLSRLRCLPAATLAALTWVAAVPTYRSGRRSDFTSAVVRYFVTSG